MKRATLKLLRDRLEHDRLLTRKCNRFQAARNGRVTHKMASGSGPWRYTPHTDGNEWGVHDAKLGRVLSDTEIARTPGLSLWIERLPH